MAIAAGTSRNGGLMGVMAKTLGIDLEEQAMRGQLAAEDLQAAAQRCGGCAETEACATWLEGAPTDAATPPEYCRNKAMFDALSRV